MAIEVEGQGLDTVNTLVSVQLGEQLENLNLMGTAAINGAGNSLDNVLVGNIANNMLEGGMGADTLVGDAAGETGIGEMVNTLQIHARGSALDGAWPVMEVWIEGVKVQSFTVGSSVSAVYTVTAPLGVSARNVDVLFTNDAYSPATSQDRNLWVSQIVVNGRVVSANGVGAVVDYGTGTGARDWINTTVGAGTLYSNGAIHFGLLGNDLLDGGAGADTLVGGYGNDLYVVDNASDVVIELSDAGHDIVRASVTYALGDNTEDLELTGPLAINATGNATRNTLRGNTAANRLDGGAGADFLVGGAGNDTYVVDNVLDVVYETANAGIDAVEASVSFALSAEVENMRLTGEAAINGTGNALDNLLVGNGASNLLAGGAGNDTLAAGAGSDKLYGGDGNDSLTGDAPGEIAIAELVGSLVVYARGTACEGGWPNMEVWLAGTRVQTFSVTSVDWAAYTVTVPPGLQAFSVDLVFANDAYRPDLGQDRNLYVDRIEVNGRTLSAKDAGAIVDYGTGVAAWDGLNTSVSSGVLASNGAIRIGLAGNDFLDGGSGADMMVGGIGNDVYVVDNLGDKVLETANAGHDIVRSAVGYVLGDNVEDLELTGVLAVSATGNATGNTLRGNSAANRIDGGRGADVMVGGAGDDTYVVDDPGDTVYEVAGAGVDTVESSVSTTLGANIENLSLVGVAAINGTGNALDNVLFGNIASNTLTGGAGADAIKAGAGNDRLYGGDGNDSLTGDAPGEFAPSERVASLVVYARGSICEGGWPTMEVWLAGVKVQTFQVTSPDFAAYTVTAPLGISASSVDLVFSNDAYRPDIGQDRNLYVERIEVNGRSLSAKDAGAVIDYGVGTGAFDGLNTSLYGGIVASNGALRIGLGGNDLLDGGTGADSMAGGYGNDVYMVDNIADTVLEATNAGHDTVRSAVSYRLGSNLEDLELLGTLGTSATGNATNNTLRGNAGANQLDGGAGADVLVGGAGSDTYVLGRGYGADTVYENDATPGNSDLARFGAGIAADQLWFRRVSSNLEVGVIGTGDKLTLSNWYSGSQYHVEQFKTSNGKTLLDSQVQNLVSAMAAFAPPAMGQTTLSPTYANLLSPVIAANWQ